MGSGNKKTSAEGTPNTRGFQAGPGMQKGWRAPAPLPTRLVSNEEYNPLPQTPAQAEVERRILAIGERTSRRLGLDRRDFLATSGGMAASLLALNQVFGRFFDIKEVEAAEPAAFAEGSGPPEFVIDVQTHYVGEGYDPLDQEKKRKGAVTKQQLLDLRKKAKATGANPMLATDDVDLPDLGWRNFIKEVFLDSETQVGLISTPPGPYPQEAVVPPREMTHIRDEINRLAQSQRMLAHGLVTPQLGVPDLEFMQRQVEDFHIDAWKAYTGGAPKGFRHGWFMDDEKIAYPMLRKAQQLKVPVVCVHKGLPLGPVEDYNHPRDIIKAAKDFPDLTFIVYHSGFKTVDGIDKTFAKTGTIPWTTEFCRMRKAAGPSSLRNIYMELGGTFAQLVSTQPVICAHLLGQLLSAFGPDRVIWGTDSVWYGSPQWQIEALRRFVMPDELREKHGYPALTPQVKRQIFTDNAARVFKIDVAKKRNEVPKDYLSRMKTAYLDDGQGRPSRRFYGWVAV
jgi:predicted TIM-barrel fold metal-dependent hydrolase